jgi:TonB family protein
MKRVCVLLVSLFLVVPVLAQNPAPTIDSLIGQSLILRSYGNAEMPKVKAGDISKSGGDCDAAIEVLDAIHDKNEVRLKLEHIGLPVIRGVQNRCPRSIDFTMLRITDLPKNTTPEAAVALVRRVLLTPEAYLNLHGRPFNRPRQDPGSTEPARSPSFAPIPLLQVNATYSEEARLARIAGIVQTEVVVGADGLIYSPKVVQGLGMGLDTQVLRVLRMWRFEPGQEGGKPVPTGIKLQMSFNIQ